MKNNLETFQRFAPKTKQGRELTSNAVIYTRVSSKEQDENTSLPYQKRRCEEYAQRKGYRVVEYFGGTYESAKNDERKEFKRMLGFVKQSKEKISRIIVLSFDRFSRSGANAIYLIETLKMMNVFVESVTQEGDYTTPSGELMQSMQMLFSKMDNDQRRQKTIAGMQEMLRQGFIPNRPPVGYKIIKGVEWENRVALDERTAPHIKKAFILKAQQEKSNVEIAELLSSSGFKIDRKRLSEIFQNPFYCGVIISTLLPEMVIQGKHPKLISEELFLQANGVNNSRYGEKHKKEYLEFPLKSFVKCDSCGTALTAYHVKNRKATYYKCNKIGCKMNRNVSHLHEKFIEYLKKYSIEPRAEKPIKKMMNRVFSQLNEQNTDNTLLFQKELLRIDEKIEKLTDKFIAEEISKEIFDSTMKRYTGEKKKIEEKISECGTHLSNIDEYIDYTLQLSKNLYEIWEKPDLETKKRLQYLVFPEGIMYNKEKNDYRTLRVNSFFAPIPYLSKQIEQNKNGHVDFDVYMSEMVVPP